MTRRSENLLAWPPGIGLVWLAMPLFVLVVRTLLQPVTPEDYWWPLALGEALRGGEWVHSNVFLYTVDAGQPFYPQAWLAHWLMASVAHYAGHAANYLLHLLLLVGTWMMLLRFGLRRGGAPVVVGVAAAVTYYMAAGGLAVRAQMFAYPLFVAFVGVLLSQLELSRNDEEQRWRWVALALITAVWSNVHGTFIFAPLLLGAAATGALVERWRSGELDRRFVQQWGAGFVAVVAATCVAPGGFENLLYLLEYASATQTETHVVEWAPPRLSSPQGALFWILLASSVIWVVVRRDVCLPELAIFLFVTAVTAGSVRALLWWGIIWTLIFAPPISRAVAARLSRPKSLSLSGAINVLLLVTFAATSLASLPGGPIFEAVDPAALYGRSRLETDRPELRVFSADNPVELAEQVLSETGGRLFHHQHAGGLLEWLLVREHSSLERVPRVVYIDQRIELTTPDHWKQYFAISQAKPGWRRALERHDVQALLLHPSEQAGLIAALEHDAGFALLARSDEWVAFVRR